jgi:hypothetical protein
MHTSYGGTTERIAVSWSIGTECTTGSHVCKCVSQKAKENEES